MDSLFKDIRYSVRSLLKRPGFTAIVVITLAVGIGASTAIFSVVNSVLLHPLPYDQADRLVMLWTDDPKHGLHQEGTSYLNFEDWKNQSQSFADLAICTRGNPVVLTGGNEPERISAEAVSGNLFSLLGRQPMLGRTFSLDDLENRERVVVLSYKLWQRRFGAARNVVGKTMEIDGQESQIIGVMPEDFFFPNKEAQLWLPVTSLKVWDREKGRRFSDWWRVVGRLKNSATVAQAQSEMNAIGRRLEAAYPIPADEDAAGFGILVIPLMDQITGTRMRLGLWSLLGAVFFVLLIACTNVANLTLARGATRGREFAIRGAIGANRLNLIGQALTESALLAGGGGLLGLLLAAAGIRGLIDLAPQDLPRLDEIRIDARVLLFTFTVSLLASILFGLLPAIKLSRTDPNEALKEGGRGLSGGPGSRRTRGVLVAAEVALSVILLTGAGLLIRSLMHVRAVDPGFDSAQLLTMKVELPESTSRSQRWPFYQQAIEHVAALPGVEAAGAIWHVFLETNPDYTVSIEGRPSTEQTNEQVMEDEVSPNFFNTVRVPLRAGRLFTDQDNPQVPEVAIVNEAMVRRFFPQENAIGKRFKFGQMNSKAAWITVVGVVGDMHRQGLEKQPIAQVFLPFAQHSEANMELVVRTAGEPTQLGSAVRAELQALDKQVTIFGVTTVERRLEEFDSQRRFQTSLLGLFALIALSLAAIGIFGVMSYTVTLRTHEMGIRLALGAQARDVLKSVIQQGMKFVLIGLSVGIVGAFWLTPVLASLLFGVGATDPLTFAGTAALLVLVAIVACYIPARRATKVDPLVALRCE